MYSSFFICHHSNLQELWELLWTCRTAATNMVKSDTW